MSNAPFLAIVSPVSCKRNCSQIRLIYSYPGAPHTLLLRMLLLKQHRPFSSSPSGRQRHQHQGCSTTTRSPPCRASGGPSSQQQPSNDSAEPAYKYSDGVNQFLGNFLPSSKAARDELSVDFSAPKLTGTSIQELARLVEAGLSKSQWFVTGEVDARLFADNFAFKDESVATSGIKSYATGVRKLFDQVGMGGGQQVAAAWQTLLATLAASSSSNSNSQPP